METVATVCDGMASRSNVPGGVVTLDEAGIPALEKARRTAHARTETLRIMGGRPL
jgi:hypothetical protein